MEASRRDCREVAGVRRLAGLRRIARFDGIVRFFGGIAPSGGIACLRRDHRVVISRLRGTLIRRDLERIEVETAGGVVYEIEVPLTILDRLPRAPAQDFEIRVLHVVREDSVTLYGFVEPQERELFKRLLGASGVGPRVALGMLSTYTAARLARALAEKDVNALKQISGVGKKTAERLVLELSDKVQDLAIAPSPDGTAPTAAKEAVAALVALGYSFADADAAVRRVMDENGAKGPDELIRKALARG